MRDHMLKAPDKVQTPGGNRMPVITIKGGGARQPSTNDK